VFLLVIGAAVKVNRTTALAFVDSQAPGKWLAGPLSAYLGAGRYLRFVFSHRGCAGLCNLLDFSTRLRFLDRGVNAGELIGLPIGVLATDAGLEPNLCKGDINRSKLGSAVSLVHLSRRAKCLPTAAHREPVIIQSTVRPRNVPVTSPC
jgi:hypothetical protein